MLTLLYLLLFPFLGDKLSEQDIISKHSSDTATFYGQFKDEDHVGDARRASTTHILPLECNVDHTQV